MATGIQIASFFYVGTAQLNEIFGGYTGPASVQIQRLQVSSRVPPTGGNITITLVDQNGGALGAEVVLASSTKYKDTQLAAPVTLVAGQIIYAKITSVDLGTAQDFQLNLIGSAAQGIMAPICGTGCCY